MKLFDSAYGSFNMDPDLSYVFSEFHLSRCKLFLFGQKGEISRNAFFLASKSPMVKPLSAITTLLDKYGPENHFVQ